MGLSDEILTIIANNAYQEDYFKLDGAVKDADVVQLCNVLPSNAYIEKLYIFEDEAAKSFPEFRLGDESANALSTLSSLKLLSIQCSGLTVLGLAQLLSLNNLDSLTIYCSEALKYAIDLKIIEPIVLELINSTKNLNIVCISNKPMIRSKIILESCRTFMNRCSDRFAWTGKKKKELAAQVLLKRTDEVTQNG